MTIHVAKYSIFPPFSHHPKGFSSHFPTIPRVSPSIFPMKLGFQTRPKVGKVIHPVTMYTAAPTPMAGSNPVEVDERMMRDIIMICKYCIYIYKYTPGTQMSLVLIRKDHLLEAKQMGSRHTYVDI